MTPERQRELRNEPPPILNPKLHESPEVVKDAKQLVFDDAKLSMEVMLPSFQNQLSKKFHDKFYMRATQQRLKLYYYFSGYPALETIALTLGIHGGYPLVWVGYIPTKLQGGSDFSKAIHEQAIATNPELAGLTMMRLVKKLLQRID
jgi:hypothetical protein